MLTYYKISFFECYLLLLLLLLLLANIILFLLQLFFIKFVYSRKF